MVFTSFLFLFAFLPLLLIAHRVTPRRGKKLTLLIGSYLFYGYWRLDFTLLLLFSTAVGYGCSRAIFSSSSPARRRAFLILGVGCSLGLLGYFKYFNFGAENLNRLLDALGAEPLTWEQVLLPVGISFFTFQTISYLVDVHRRSIPPADSLLDFAVYVALFPQLVAGPIVRFGEIAAQLRAPDRGAQGFGRGVLLFVIGFNKKVLLANNVGLVADQVFQLESPGALNGWIGLLAYSFQIYFDFSGYSDMAVGLGGMLGFRFPLNFYSPYKSQSITEFWRRWHVSLSRFLRDYLYIPLGGNRRGRKRTFVNLGLTMLLGGLWHGAAWTFLVWGGYHGLLLALERWNGRRPLLYGAAPAPLRAALTFLLVALGWVPFRSDSLEGALALLGALAGVQAGAASELVAAIRQPVFTVALAASAWIAFFGRHSWEIARDLAAPSKWLHLALFAIAVQEMLTQGFNPFIYFRF